MLPGTENLIHRGEGYVVQVSLSYPTCLLDQGMSYMSGSADCIQAGPNTFVEGIPKF